MIDLCDDVQCIFTKGNDFRQNAISFKAKKSLKKFKRIWSVFKLPKNLTIVYFQTLLNLFERTKII